jgi:hypothetical protein
MTSYDDEKNGLPPVSCPAAEIGHYNDSILGACYSITRNLSDFPDTCHRR